MSNSRFNLINNVLGWFVFIISSIVYLSTIEPTVSLWDCGEFIAGSYKLEVVHPPGAPFFLMFNHLFTMLAPNPEWVPVIVNISSALASSFTILFLFWTITILARRLIIKDISNVNTGEVMATMGSGLIGALAFTFSDTFWFSAVEGEVYALSSMFIAIVFWLLLKWEKRADEPNHLRWLILIAYLMGLSIGVHLLSLLVLPVVPFVYYFKKYEKITTKGIIAAGFLGLLTLGIVNVVIIKWFPLIASRFDLLFVNTFGLPYWSGVLFTLFLTFALIGYAIYYTIKRNYVVLNTVIVAMFFVFIGYTSYTMVAIRSMANTPINYSSPDNIFNMISYINREQYGDRPLLYGPYFTAGYPVDYKEGRMRYIKGEEDGKPKYIAVGKKKKPVYDEKHKTIFPRMSDSRADRKQGYRDWSGMRTNQKKPTFAQNLKFFRVYQLGHMYFRYFAWNFIGRQNDEQGHGSFLRGNWKSGISGLDKKVGPSSNLPYVQRVNNADNNLYYLPFLLGIIGLIFHFRKSKRDASIVLILFFMTGVLLIVYLNSPPFEPRERDYVTVGSFYFFAIWIGMGVLALINAFKKKMNLVTASGIVFVITLVLVPGIMANEEWDDHNRSHRFTSKNYGMNYLNSCDTNAILFTNGDNDTYPLWYVQEVEGIRDDVRVINLQLLMTDWYVGQLKRKINNSDAIKFSFKQEDISEGKRDQVFFIDKHPIWSKSIDPNKYYDLMEILNFIRSDDKRTKIPRQQNLDFYPTKKFKIPVDKEKVLKNGTVRPEMKDRIVDFIEFNIGKRSILKNSLMVLDIIASNQWERPIYFAITSGKETFMNLNDYLQQEGMTYRLVPIKRTEQEKVRGENGRVDAVIMYDNIMNKFEWGNLTDDRVHIGSVTRRHCNNYRNVFCTLGKKLLSENEIEKTVEVLDKCMAVLPEEKVPYRLNSVQIAEEYYLAGNLEKDEEKAEEYRAKGRALALRLKEIFTEESDYYNGLSSKLQKRADTERQRNEYGLRVIADMARRYSDDALLDFTPAEEELPVIGIDTTKTLNLPSPKQP